VQGTVFSQEVHAMSSPALAHEHTERIPEPQRQLNMPGFVVAVAESSTGYIPVMGRTFRNNVSNVVVAAGKEVGAMGVNPCKFTDDFKTFRCRFSIAGEGISHGGERLQEGRSQGDTKRKSFVFGA